MATMTEGRQGEPKEFVEFQIVSRRRLNLVAQRSGSLWFVYLVDPADRGIVHTIVATGSNRDQAVATARGIAEALERLFSGEDQ